MGIKEGRVNRVVLLADAAEVLVVLRLHELISHIGALVHQPLTKKKHRLYYTDPRVLQLNLRNSGGR